MYPSSPKCMAKQPRYPRKTILSSTFVQHLLVQKHSIIVVNYSRLMGMAKKSCQQLFCNKQRFDIMILCLKVLSLHVFGTQTSGYTSKGRERHFVMYKGWGDSRLSTLNFSFEKKKKKRRNMSVLRLARSFATHIQLADILLLYNFQITYLMN